MLPPHPGFETTISAGERMQTYALDRAATGTGIYIHIYIYIYIYIYCVCVCGLSLLRHITGSVPVPSFAKYRLCYKVSWCPLFHTTGLIAGSPVQFSVLVPEFIAAEM
jgi:hypothetical protein